MGRWRTISTIETLPAYAYLDYLATPRGRLRAALERRALRAAVPTLYESHPLRLLDAGCGPQPISLELVATGHNVTLLDTDQLVLNLAVERAAALLARGMGTLQQRCGALENGADLAGYDVVLCHHVLEFCDNVEVALDAAVAALAPGGVLSIVAPNAAGMALQSYARDGDAGAAVAALESGVARPGLSGERRRAFLAPALLRALRTRGLRAHLAAGILVLAPLRPDRDTDAALEEQEWALARHAAFRAVGRHMHVVAVGR